MVMMKLFLPIIFFASIAFAAPATSTDECGSYPDQQEMSLAEIEFGNMTAEWVDGGDREDDTESGDDSPPINVYWHVVYKDKTEPLGWVPKKHIKDSMKVLNKAFKRTGFRFKLRDISRTQNAAWWASFYGSPEQAAMKDALHRGGKKTLNVYTASIPGLRGYATFPWEYSSRPKQDGVVVEPSTLVGGSQIGYNYGITLVHEVGHWAGLYHTFQGGCSEPGDHVSDTPQEATPSYTCDTSRDTCPGGGRDPVRNYMDYSPHKCKDRFSRGQRVRMRHQMRFYRHLRP